MYTVDKKGTLAADVKRVSSVAQSRFRRNVRDRYAASSTTRHAHTSRCFLLRCVASCCVGLLLPDRLGAITVMAEHGGRRDCLEYGFPARTGAIPKHPKVTDTCLTSAHAHDRLSCQALMTELAWQVNQVKSFRAAMRLTEEAAGQLPRQQAEANAGQVQQALP